MDERTEDAALSLPAETGEPSPSGAPVRPRATGPMHEGAPIGIAIGVLTAIGFATLAWLVAFAFFAAVAIYALVKAIGDAEDHGNPVVVVLITVFLLTVFVALLCIGVGKIGASLSPKRRRRDG